VRRATEQLAAPGRLEWPTAAFVLTDGWLAAANSALLGRDQPRAAVLAENPAVPAALDAKQPAPGAVEHAPIVPNANASEGV
jgi:hypothetical protein